MRPPGPGDGRLGPSSIDRPLTAEHWTSALTVYQLLLWLHIAVFGVWFGTDLATFHLSRKVTDADLAVPSRATLAGAMMGVEVLARLSLPTMLALGVALSIEVG